jgi:hypothetical protein
MKAYLAVTGIIFGLLAVLHLGRMIAEWRGVAASRAVDLGMDPIH